MLRTFSWLRRDRRPRGDGAVATPTAAPTRAAAMPDAARQRPIADVRSLAVYQSAFTGAGRIFAATERFPAREHYQLTSQVRRASRSVCANIVEGWQKRRYRAAFVGKLNDAAAEAAETIFWLATARRCGYLDPVVGAALQRRYAWITAELARMQAAPDEWGKG